jgi:hypothetical protein
MLSKRNLCTVFIIHGRKLENRMTSSIGIRMGIGQENHCEMLFPRGSQESSNSLVCFSNCSWSCLILFLLPRLINIEAAFFLQKQAETTLLCSEQVKASLVLE